MTHSATVCNWISKVAGTAARPLEDKRVRHVRGCFHHERLALMLPGILCVCSAVVSARESTVFVWHLRQTVGAPSTGHH